MAESGDDRWRSAAVAAANLADLSCGLDDLQNFLGKKAVFVDEDTYAHASLVYDQGNTIKDLERRVATLEQELDAAIKAAASSRFEKRQAEAAQQAAELRVQEITRELENTSRVFKLHMEELRLKQAEISKRDAEIKVLGAIIRTISRNSSKRS